MSSSTCPPEKNLYLSLLRTSGISSLSRSFFVGPCFLYVCLHPGLLSSCTASIITRPTFLRFFTPGLARSDLTFFAFCTIRTKSETFRECAGATSPTRRNVNIREGRGGFDFFQSKDGHKRPINFSKFRIIHVISRADVSRRNERLRGSTESSNFYKLQLAAGLPFHCHRPRTCSYKMSQRLVAYLLIRKSAIILIQKLTQIQPVLHALFSS